MFTYYYLENGEVMFIENFDTAEEALELKHSKFPNSTLTVRVGDHL